MEKVLLRAKQEGFGDIGGLLFFRTWIFLPCLARESGGSWENNSRGVSTA